MDFSKTWDANQSIWSAPRDFSLNYFDDEAKDCFSGHFFIRPLTRMAAQKRSQSGLEKLVPYAMGIAFGGLVLALVESVVRLALAIICLPQLPFAYQKGSISAKYSLLFLATAETAVRASLEAISYSFKIFKEEESLVMDPLVADHTWIGEYFS